MTDYKYLKENNLFEAHLRFTRALGESFGYSPIEEEDDDQQAGPNGGMPPVPDAMGGDAPADGGGMPPSPDAMGGGQDPMGGAPAGGPDAMGGVPDGGMPPSPDAMGGPEGGMTGPDTMGGGIEEEMPEEDETVIDVDDITKAQEKANDKINAVGKDLGKVDTRIEKLIGAIDKLEGLFDKNNQEIEDLKAEFEKRNPTQTEKLNLRSLDSYPFKIKPTDYWADKSNNSNYSAYSDNNEPTTHEYVITNDDVDDFSEREIADSFASLDDSINQDIKRIFGLA